MKKYEKPHTEIAIVRLEGSVLGDPGTGTWSNGIIVIDAKESDMDWGDDNFTPDLWGDEEEEDY